MEVIRTRFLHAAHIRAEIGEIRRQDGGRDDDRALDMDMLFFLTAA